MVNNFDMNIYVPVFVRKAYFQFSLLDLGVELLGHIITLVYILE